MYASRWGGGCGWPVAGVLAGVVAQVLPMHLLDVDAYELLGLARGRNYGYSDINKAYRRASLKVHPDKEGGPLEVRGSDATNSDLQV